MSDTDLTALHDDVAALKRDVASLVAHLKSGATNGAQSAAEGLDAGARRLYAGVTAEGEHSLKAISAQIEARPMAALLVALGVGYLGGRLLAR